MVIVLGIGLTFKHQMPHSVKYSHLSSLTWLAVGHLLCGGHCCFHKWSLDQWHQRHPRTYWKCRFPGSISDRPNGKLRDGSRDLSAHKLPRWFWCLVKCESHRCRTLGWASILRGRQGKITKKNTNSKTIQIMTHAKYKIKPSAGTEGDEHGFFREDGQSRGALMWAESGVWRSGGPMFPAEGTANAKTWR